MTRQWLQFQQQADGLGLDECGFQQYDQFRQYDYSAFQNYVIHFVLRGQGQVEINRQVFQVGPNQGFVIRRGDHARYFPLDKAWEYRWIGLSGSDFDQYIGQSLLDHQRYFSYEPQMACFNVLNQVIDLCFQQKNLAYREILLKSLCYQFLYEICREFPNTDHPIITSQTKNYEEIAYDYILNNFQHPITIQDVAHYVGISRSYLYKLFKLRYQTSPQSLLMTRRMEYASYLLGHTQLTINEIANAVGYDDQLLFSRTFKRYYQQSPSHYRLHNQGNI